MKKRDYPELRDVDICVDSDFFVLSEKVNFYLETWFDVERYFGIKVVDTGSYVNLYADIDKKGNVTGTYVLVSDDKESSYPWEFTNTEKKRILAKCEAIVLKSTGMSIVEFIENEED